MRIERRSPRKIRCYGISQHDVEKWVNERAHGEMDWVVRTVARRGKEPYVALEMLRGGLDVLGLMVEEHRKNGVPVAGSGERKSI